MAAVLKDSDLLVRLSDGDLASNEAYYHDHSYFRFRNRYNRKIKHNQDVHEKNPETLIKIIYQATSIECLRSTERECTGTFFHLS